MELSNFATLLQLAATLNIAFIAIEYAKTFTYSLSEIVFQFKDMVKIQIDECKNILPDDESLKSLKPTRIGENGSTTLTLIEKVKVETFRLRDSLDQEEKKTESRNLFEFKSLSAVSLYLFLFCLLSLFCSSICLSENKLAHHFFWITFSSLSFLYVLFIWVFGEKEYKKCKFMNSFLSSFKYNIIVFFVILIVSLTLLLSISSDALFSLLDQNCWKGITILTSLITFANFVVFFFKTKYKSNKEKKRIAESFETIKNNCTLVKNEYDSILLVSAMEEQLKIDDERKKNDKPMQNIIVKKKLVMDKNYQYSKNKKY